MTIVGCDLHARQQSIAMLDSEPTLADFLKNDFVPFVETKNAVKPATVEYY